jgi:uncharacterized protein
MERRRKQMAHRDPTPEVEQRTTAAPVELRAAAGGSSRMIGGFAARFDCPSEPLPFTEVIDRRAFNKAEADGFPGCVARYQHSDLAILGAVASGTLRLSVAPNLGLSYEVSVPESRDDVLELVRRGDLSYSSFSFQADDDSWGYQDGAPLRTVLSARVIDVAPCTSPAYKSTSVAMRSLARQMNAEYDDVVRRCESGRLAEFFVRTDRSPRRMSGREAVLKTLEKRWPAAPSGDSRSRRMSGREAVLKTLEARWPKPRAFTPRQRQVELLGKRWGPQ